MYAHFRKTLGAAGGVRLRRILACAFSVIFVWVLASCSSLSKRASDDDLIGEWRGSGGAVLTLNPGHRFVAKQFPLQIIASDSYDAPQDASGSWSIERRGLEAARLDLTIKRSGYQLTIGNEHGRWVIFYYITDPDLDKRYVFHKAVSG